MTTPPPAALPPDPEVRPEQIKSAPFYLPNLVAALASAIAVAVGSIGPWIAFMGMSRNNIGDGADGTITLILGIVAALALFALLNFGRTQVRSKRMVALGTVAGIAGVLAFLIGFIDAQEVSSRKTEILGKTIGPEIGWGLWMILIAGPALAITSAIVVKQVMNIAKANAEPPASERFRIDMGGSRPTPSAKPAPPAAPVAPQPAVKILPPPTPPIPTPTTPVPTPPVPTPPPVAPVAAVPEPAPPSAVVSPPPAPLPPTPPAPPTPRPVAPPPPPRRVADLPPTPVSAPTLPPPPVNSDVGRSGLRRAAPWAGGAAALAAAVAAGVWAGPYLTGGDKTTEPAAAPTSTTTMKASTTTTTVVPSSTTTSSPTASAAGSGASSAPATFGPFTSGDAKVLVGGQPREVRGDVSCFLYGGKVNISIGPMGNPVGATITEADTRVSSVSLGNVDGVMLAYLDGAANGSATATKDGKSYRITGTAAGVDLRNPLQPYTRPFEISVTCP